MSERRKQHPFGEVIQSRREINRSQEQCLRAVDKSAELFSVAGIQIEKTMVVSGGGVLLHQLARRGSSDRVPTDLDWIIMPESQTRSDGKTQLSNMQARAQDIFSHVEVIAEPRHHHGATFSNVILHANTQDS